MEFIQFIGEIIIEKYLIRTCVRFTQHCSIAQDLCEQKDTFIHFNYRHTYARTHKAFYLFIYLFSISISAVKTRKLTMNVPCE